MSYATLDDVKQHLRYDDNSNDVVLQAYLDASEQVINRFITDAVTDDMQPVLRAATLLLCGYLDDDRNSETVQNFTPTFSGLQHSVQMLLQQYRAPTVV